MTDLPAARNARTRDASALLIGSLASGLLAYVFFATATRALGPADAAPVSVLWTYWSLSSAAFTFPLQHWVARTIAAHGDEARVRSALPRVAAVVAMASVVLGLLAWIVRSDLFGRDDVAFPLLVAGVTVGSGVMGISRGVLSGRRRFGAVAGELVAENGLRCLVAFGLAVAGVDEPLAYGLALLSGHGVVVCWPSSLMVRRGRSAAIKTDGRSAVAFLSGASSGQLLAQVVLTGSPVLLALRGGSAAEVTALFVGLALYRAPYTLGLGLVAPLTGMFTTYTVRGEHASLARALKLIVVGGVLGVVAATAIGSTFGPALIRLVFGADVRLPADTSTALAGGSAVAVANLVTTVLVLALGRAVVVAWAWAGGLVVALLVLLLLAGAPGSEVDHTAWSFVAAQTTAFVVLTATGHRLVTRPTRQAGATSDREREMREY